MGRIRTVKPELFKHGDLFDAERDSGLPLRLAFIALFTCCDREGRFKWRPRDLKLDCLPHDDVDFSRVLDALTTRGFVVRYASPDGSEFGCIPTFPTHQVINNREGVSTIPSPTDTGVVTRDPRVHVACPTPAQGKGREGKGRERKDTPLPPSGDRDEIRDQFLSLWESYEKHGVRKTAAEYWMKLKPEDRKVIISKAPEYVKSTSGDRLQYRKHLEGWINPEKRLWERPIVVRNEPAIMTKAKADEQLRELRSKLGRTPGALVEYHEMPRELYEFYKANP